MRVADELRRGLVEIARRWEADVAGVPALAALPRGALIDHLPEFLEALAAWLDGTAPDAARAFSALSDGHAMQRLGAGIDLGTLTIEYARLRGAILAHLAARAPGAIPWDELIRLDRGLDLAIGEAIRRYASQRDAIRERFIGILGHDLRNPVGAVLMAASSLIADRHVGPRHGRIAARILRAAQRMQRMIDDVLDFARGHLGPGIPSTPRRGDLGELCRAAADELRGAEPGADVRLDLRGDLRGHWDPDRVVQALVNLLINAVQYGAGPVTLRAWEADDRGSVLTAVHNAGPPIPPDALPHLFDPFARGERAAGAGAGGLGLGLYIVAQIARAHGGTCDVASTAEDGTTVTVRWPRAAGDAGLERP